MVVAKSSRLLTWKIARGRGGEYLSAGVEKGELKGSLAETLTKTGGEDKQLDITVISVAIVQAGGSCCCCLLTFDSHQSCLWSAEQGDQNVEPH